MAPAVSVLGKDLVLEKGWSRRPRLLHDGRELPRDRWGVPVLTGEDGRSHQVLTSFSWRRLSPVLEVDGQRTPVLAPLPTPARAALLALVVVGLAGGAAGAALGLSAAAASAALLRHPRRGTRHVVAAVLVPVAAITAFLLVAGWLSLLR